MKILTLKDLEIFLGTLDEEVKQSSPAIVVNMDEDPKYINSIKEGYELQEDMVYNEDSEGWMPVSEYNPDDYEGVPLTDDTYNTIVPKGTRAFLSIE